MGGREPPDRGGEISHPGEGHSVFNLRSGSRSALILKEMDLQNGLFATTGDRIAKLVALFFCSSLTLPPGHKLAAWKCLRRPAVSSSLVLLPQGVKVLASIPLQGAAITRMHTQREYGQTFLYIEHGQQSLTTVDVSKKRNRRIVQHRLAKVEPVRYELLSEGRSMEVWPRHVTAGVDTRAGHGRFSSVLEGGDPNDAKLLQAFVAENANLVDRDSRLVYFASPSQLLVVRDNRPTAFDFTNYAN